MRQGKWNAISVVQRTYIFPLKCHSRVFLDTVGAQWQLVRARCVIAVSHLGKAGLNLLNPRWLTRMWGIFWSYLVWSSLIQATSQWHPCIHYFRPEPYGSPSKGVHYIVNSVPFGTNNHLSLILTVWLKPHWRYIPYLHKSCEIMTLKLKDVTKVKWCYQDHLKENQLKQ